MENKLQVSNNINQIAVTSEDPMLAMIDRVCSDPNFDITKMEKLIDMRNAEFERLEDLRLQDLMRIAKLEFNTNYVPMSNELPLVSRSKENKFTRSKYAALEDVNEAIKPVLAKYGFGLSCDILKQTKEDVTVAAILIHKGGHEKSLELTMALDTVGAKGEATKTNIQGTSSSITYAKRVAICALLNISTGDDKDGNKSVDTITLEQAAGIDTLIRESKTNREKFLKIYLGVSDPREIHKKDLARARNLLETKLKKLKEGNSNENS